MKGPRFDTSIMALLPEHQQNPQVDRAISQISDDLSAQVTLVITAAEKENARHAVAYLAEQLSSLSSIADVIWQSETSAAFEEELYPYRFVLLSDEVSARLSNENYPQQTQLALHRIFGPFSGSRTDPLRDPFTLSTDLTLGQQSELRVIPEQGLLKLLDAEEPAYLIALRLKGDPFSLPIQQQVVSLVGGAEKHLAEQEVSVLKSGLLWHAAAGAAQAKSEISTIGAGSLLGIMLLIMLVFRRISHLWLVLLPVSVGCAMAVATTLLIFDRVHLITLTFGAGLVGVSVDYAMHFICERQKASGHLVVKTLFVGLFLGLFSSVIAYAGLALAPFPGLRQMAIFSVAGLIAAWLSVLLWLPYLGGSSKGEEQSIIHLLDRCRAWLPSVDQRPAIGVLLVLVSVAALFVVLMGQPKDSIRLLQTSTSALISEDAQVQSLLGNTSSAAFILVTGPNAETVLQREEQLRENLDGLKRQYNGFRYTALSQMLPSVNQQDKHATLVKQLYSDQLGDMTKVLRFNEQQLKQVNAHMESAIEHRLQVDSWASLKVSQAWAHLIVEGVDAKMATVIRFSGASTDALVEQLNQSVNTIEGVYYVDRVAQISAVLADYRVQITQWLLVAYGFVVIILACRYRRDLWRILAPPVVASLVTFAILIAVNGGYNLFNLIALMLVLGIGLDMGIFLYETNSSARTWLAVSLSALTSMLAFGLLMLSETPVLYHFGVVVLPGLLLVWLLTPLMRIDQYRSNK